MMKIIDVRVTGLTGVFPVIVSGDGKNVYVVEFGDSSISEFARHADGSLTPVPNNDCIAENENDVCQSQGAHGLGSVGPPDALAVSP